ncbi:MAG: efflux RND transporter periplasmic adaptor subunit [Planctomycetota bacterium]|nr:efflux RND transporter periplasmic adaptor subunit [Planctomycetota bacterium]
MTDTTLSSLRPNDEPGFPPPKRRTWLRMTVPLAIIAAAGALLASTGWDAIRPRRAVVATTVGVRTVEAASDATPTRDGAVAVQAPGWVEPDPFDVFVSALVDGVVDEILVLEGDRVEAGQVVATLVDDEARIAVRKAEATVSERTARLAEARATLAAAEVDRAELVDSERRVAVTGAKEAQLAAELAGFPARRAALDATRAEIADEYERKRRVVESGAVPAGVVERLGIRLAAIDAQIDALDAEQSATEARLQAAAAESRAASRDRELLVAETLAVDIARTTVDTAAALVAEAEASLALAELALERCLVRTPIDGVVIERLTSPGSRVSFGGGPHTAHIVHLYDPAELQVRADVPLADAAKVGVGQQAEIVVDLLPDTVFRGEVTRFVHRADLAKNTVEAKVRILDPSPLLKPDMLARVRIMESGTTDPSGGGIRTVTRMFAPPGTVVDDSNWIVSDRDSERGVARRVSVETGERVADGWIEIVDGLEPGDLVILDGSPTEGEPIRFVLEGSATS